MSKIIVLCCILLPAVCHATCAAGEDSCNMMDEAALVQKDLSLAQKGTQKPADIDRATVAKHLSEAHTLLYLEEGHKVKLEQAKKVLEVAKSTSEAVLAATGKYQESEHSEADFESWYDAVSDDLGKLDSSVDSEKKQADDDVKEIRDYLTSFWDSFDEHAKTYAQYVSLLAARDQRSRQVNLFASTIEGVSKEILDAMDKYKEKTKDGFVDKKFGKTYGTILQATYRIRANLEGMVAINEQKMKEVEEAKKEYTSRTKEEVDKAMLELTTLDKTTQRNEIAQQMKKEFEPLDAEYVKGIQEFSESKRTDADFKALRSTVEGALAKMESKLKANQDADKKAESEAKEAVLASFDNLNDEGEFAQKIMKFTTSWGRQRLDTDLVDAVRYQQGQLKAGLDKYEQATENKDAEFGECYKQMIVSLIAVKSTFQQWATVSEVKHQQVVNTVGLNAWLKQ